MYGIEVLVEEHENVRTFTGIVRRACCAILNGAPVAPADFRDMIVFIREYADQHHHGKEEKLLFGEMMDALGPVAVNLVQHGMLVEHELGRLHVMNLEAALDRYEANPNTMDKLDIVAEATGYANLLLRHLEKENQVLFPFAEKNLPSEALARIEQRIRQFEEEAKAAGVQDAHLARLRRLAEKYPA